LRREGSVTIISARDVDPLKVLQLADPRTAMTAGHADVGTAIAVPISRPIRACAGAYWAISLGGWESSIVIDRRLACQGSAPQVRRRFRFSFVRNAARFRRRKTSRRHPLVSLRVARLRAASTANYANFSSVALACSVHRSTPIAMTIRVIARPMTRPAHSRSTL
jgi:hypothetical protein